MKVFQIATSATGGAGIAASRLNVALNNIGVNSTLISNKAKDGEYRSNVLNVRKSKIESFNSKSLTLFQRKIIQSGDDLVTLFSASTLDLDELIGFDPDLIHIHSFYNLLNLNDVVNLIKSEIPIFFTLHDERILTGGCHCTNGCDKFESNCEKCPQSRMLFRNSIVRNHLNLRKILENETNVTLICPSNWMADQVFKAGLNPKIHSEVVRNPVSSNYLDNRVFQPNIKSNLHFVVTFVAQELQNSYKGLQNVLECISNHVDEFRQNNFHFNFVGHGPMLTIKGVSFTQYPNLSESDLIEIYKSTDLLLVPSKTDNCPNVIFEAAMCGTPFLGSDRAGLPELSELFGLQTFEYGISDSLRKALMNAKNTKIDREMIRKLAFESVNPQKIAENIKELYQKKLTEAASMRSNKDF